MNYVAVRVVCILVLASSLLQAGEHVLVQCDANGTCEYRRVGTVLIAGRPTVRLVSSTGATVSPAELKNSRETKIEQIYGLYRDPSSRLVYALSDNGTTRVMALPSKIASKTQLDAVSLWQSATFEYGETAKSKSHNAVAPDSFVALLSSDADDSSVAFLQFVLNSQESGARRVSLIKGALRLAGNSAMLKQSRESLLERMRKSYALYDEQKGDPSTLATVLREAVQLRKTYLEIATSNENQDLLDAIAQAGQLYDRRIAILETLRKSAYWDEYLIKVQQLGLAKWTVPDLLPHVREALEQSSRLHSQRAAAFFEAGLIERAFDEAKLAAARNPCNATAQEQFYRYRVQFVNRNQIPAARDYDGGNRSLLEQIVRELDALDPQKEELTLQRIRQGKDLDPKYLPLRWKEAEFNDLLGRYTDALRVIIDIEREAPMDGKQMERSLGLDGRVRNNFIDALQKSQEETRKRFDRREFDAVVAAAERGLRADPANPRLSYYRALSLAFLRKSAEAEAQIRSYLTDGNLLCASGDEPDKMLELYRLLLSRAPRHSSSDGVPNWISGQRYREGEVFYDPISMGFLQPIERIITNKGPSTVFEWEGRSFLVRSIATSWDSTPGVNAPPHTKIFNVEPKYDRKVLSMLEIGSPATSTGERTAHALTYLNSPGVDPDLVYRYSGRQIARGWAGNPFFHPFIWNGMYIFDLTYDRLGRLERAVPVHEEAGVRRDPFSEELVFSWEGDSNRLLSVRGVHSGYRRDLSYEKDGRLKSEKITYPKGEGSISYEYVPNSSVLKLAKFSDNFFTKLSGVAFFNSTR